MGGVWAPWGWGVGAVALLFGAAWVGGVEARGDEGAGGGRVGVVSIPAAAQRLGDPEAGLRYLLHGDYIGAGIPLGLWRLVSGGPVEGDPLGAGSAMAREGVDPSVPYDMNQFVTPEGAEVVAGVNCLGCHATEFMGEFVIGLGNTSRDWGTRGPNLTALEVAAGLMLAPDSADGRAMARFLRGARALSGETGAAMRGVNPAFRIEEVAASWRRADDLRWSEAPVFDHGPWDGIASDVPAWWHIQKKHGLYANGMGRGDFARLIQQIGVVMIEDAAHAASITGGMRDLLAYLHTLEPPVYPGEVDAALVEAGRAVFERSCAECHGTYGEVETYPNLLVPVEIVGTDAVYAERLMSSGLTGWFNESWFAGDGASYAAPTRAYVAPPLDGVWATAPYFHNGSVPTLVGVLDSSARPSLWRRSFRSDDYDLERVGWNYTVPAEGEALGRDVYDTRKRGFGNGGHTFGDALSGEERRALLEYLKTL